MLFALKKWIGGLLLPLPLLLLIMACGLILLFFTQRQKAGKISMLIAWGALLLLSLQPIADRFLAPLEQHYPTLNSTSHADYIVILGGGYTYNPQWAPSSNLINNSLARVNEGIRQLQLNPNARLIFTGAAALNNSVSAAQVAAKVAESLGVPAQHIIMLDTPRDTQEEAVAVAHVVGDHPLVLVTSANHLPRALAFFQAQGLSPIPAPANQLALQSPLNPWEKALPAPLYLSHSERAWYEYLGQLWQKMTGSGT